MTLAIFIRDTAARSAWACPVALLLFAIERSNEALMESFK